MHQCLVIVIVEPHEELVGGIEEVDTEQLKELTTHPSPIQTYTQNHIKMKLIMATSNSLLKSQKAENIIHPLSHQKKSPLI